MTDRTAAVVLAFVRSRVRVRFSLSADEFAEHVRAAARKAGCVDDPMPCVRLLNLNDLYLAVACARRDERAWAECVGAHAGFMRQFAARFLSSADAAELTDRVIADLWENGKLGLFGGRSSLRTWLGAVVAHAALQAGKVSRRLDSNVERERSRTRLAPAAGTPDEQQAARLLATVTAEAISGLPDEQKLLLLLHYEQGLSLEQIAPILKSSKATLSRRLRRLREEVRASIDRLARDRYRSSGEDVRGNVDLGRVEIDLSAILAGSRPVKGSGGESI